MSSTQPAYLYGRGRGRGKQTTPSGTLPTRQQSATVNGNGLSQQRPGNLQASAPWSRSVQSLQSPSLESQRLEACKKEEETEQCKWTVCGLYCMSSC